MLWYLLETPRGEKDNNYLDTNFLDREFWISTWKNEYIFYKSIICRWFVGFYKTDDRLWNSGRFPTLVFTLKSLHPNPLPYFSYFFLFFHI